MRLNKYAISEDPLKSIEEQSKQQANQGEI